MRTRFTHHTEYAFDSLSEDRAVAPDAAVLLKLLCPGSGPVCEFLDEPLPPESLAAGWHRSTTDRLDALGKAAATAEVEAGFGDLFAETRETLSLAAAAVDAAAARAFAAAARADLSWLPDMYRRFGSFVPRFIDDIALSVGCRCAADGLSVGDGIAVKSHEISSLVEFDARIAEAAEMGPGVGWDFVDGLGYYGSLPGHPGDLSPRRAAWSAARRTKSRPKSEKRALLRSLDFAASVFGRDCAQAMARGASVCFGGAYEYRVRVTDVWRLGHGGVEVSAHDPASGAKLADLCVFMPGTPPLDQAAAFKMMVDAEGDMSLMRIANLTVFDAKTPEGQELVRPIIQLNREKREERVLAAGATPDARDVVGHGRVPPVPAKIEKWMAELKRLEAEAARIAEVARPLVIEAFASSAPRRPRPLPPKFDLARVSTDLELAFDLPRLAAQKALDPLRDVASARLQIDSELAAPRRLWRAQRTGAAVMVA